MNLGKKITELREGAAISGESSYPVSMGDGTGTKQVKHKTLVAQLLKDLNLGYEETMELLDGADNGNGAVKAIRDWLLSRIVNNLLATEEGFFMDARQGPEIAKKFSEINSNLNTIQCGNGTMAYVNPGMLIGAVKVSSKKEIKALVATPKILDDSFMTTKGLSPIIIVHTAPNSAQARLYSTTGSFTQDDAVDFYYLLVTDK